MSLPQCHGVPIAMAGGRLSVKVKIKQNENESGPKLEVDGYLSSLHVLLSPQQLAMLLEMASGLTSQGQSTLTLFLVSLCLISSLPLCVCRTF